MIILDTSALIRFFTQDDPIKGEQVKKLLESGEELVIPEVVFPEIQYVLRNLYKAKREKIIKAFQFLAAQKNVKLTSQTKKAIDIFSTSNLDMADCLIAVYSQDGQLASFDEKMLKLSGVKAYWKL